MKRAIYTVVDKNYVEIAGITQQNNLSYACENSADYINFTSTENSLTSHFSKIYGAISLLETGYDEILYIDIDAVFLDNDVNIFDLFSIFSEKELHFCGANKERTYLNSGLFLAKNTDNVKEFFKECKEPWEKKYQDEIDPVDFEQYTINRVWSNSELYKKITKVHEPTAFNENSRWICHPTFINDSKFSDLDKIEVKKIVLTERLNNKKECRYSFADRMIQKLESMTK